MTVASDVNIDSLQVREWVAEAGDIARHYFGRVNAEWKGLADPVTVADREIERLLSGYLRETYPDHGIIGEEYGSADLERDTIWAIDPIDGTRSYVEGLPTWSITLGLLHQGRPVFGLVYQPMIEDWVYTDGDDVVNNGHSIRDRLRDTWEPDSYIFARSDATAIYDIPFTRIMAFGSTASHIAYTARGASVATLAHDAYVWDVAGGAAILAKQGGEILLGNGQPLDLSQHDLTQPIRQVFFAGHPAVTRRLRALVTERPQARTHPAW